MTPNLSITSSDWLKSATEKLSSKGIQSSRIDALIMLEDCLKLSRGYLLSHSETVIDQSNQLKLRRWLDRRLKHEPMAYITNEVDFHGHNYYIDRSVLIPRPESESFVELIKKIGLRKNTRVADVGSGSGCIGITLKLELPNVVVDLYEISPQALAISKKNAKLLAAEVSFNLSNLLNASARAYDVVVANLPYVPDSFKLDQATAYEPKQALMGGQDGLDLYRALYSQISSYNWQPSFILTESLKIQHQDMEKQARNFGYNLIKTDGLVQMFKRLV